MTRTLLLVLLITSNFLFATSSFIERSQSPSLFPLDHEESRESRDDGYGFFPLTPSVSTDDFQGSPRLSRKRDQVPLKIQSPDTVTTRSRRSSTVTSATVSPHSVENDSLLDDLEANLANNDNALTLNESLSPRKFTLATIIKRHCCCFIPEAVWACAGCLCLALYCLAYSLAYRIMELFNSAPNNKT